MLGVALLAWVAGGVITSLAAREADARLRDSRLVQLADTVVAFSEHELAEIAQDMLDGVLDSGVHVEPRGTLDQRYRYQIWAVGGPLLMRSVAAPQDRPLSGSHELGFGQSTLAEGPVRTFVRRSGKIPIEIQVAERMDSRGDTLGMLGMGMVGVMLLSMGAITLLGGWLVVRTLRPVVAAEQQLRQRQPYDLAPLQVDDAPRELQPLLNGLNQLLWRMADKLSRERGFSTLAAHELRTPLAALRLQSQVALRETDPLRREQHLRELAASVDRCDHLLEQLLTLARLEQQEAAPLADVDLGELCEQVLDDLEPELARRAIRLDVELAAQRLVGRPFALQVLLRNLIVNALAHAPDGGRVLVSSRQLDGCVVLAVDDSGPGIAPADRSRVFERFVRLAGPGQHEGVGLGLSIVRNVADDHGAGVELVDSPLGGLCVRISFPARGPGSAPDPAGSPDRAP